MDQGMWAIWYDIAPENKSAYLDWFHRVHLPEKLSRPGYLWAAHYTLQQAGGDCGYLALFGGVTAHAFLNPSPGQLKLRQEPETLRMTALRTDATMCVLAQEARINGPDVTKRGPGITPGPVIQMGNYSAPSPALEDDLGAWYAQHRFPALRAMPGVIGVRKMLATVGLHKHAILYEFASLEMRERFYVPHEAEAQDARTWTARVTSRLQHAPRSPAIGQRIWPAV